jgi:D-glycero-alpha-D-manno-heptose 1-phosphate guanylyltransferase
MQFVLLAGGLGTRLKGTIPERVPKPMALVSGRPFLERLLDIASGAGSEEVVLLLGHQSSVIIDHFGSVYRGLPVRYVVEETPLGTGGAIRNAIDVLAERFILLNGDSYAEVDFRALMSHLENGPLAMTLTPVADAGRFGTVAVENDRAVRFVEKGVSGPGLVNAGIYACARQLVETLPPARPSSFEVDVLEARLPELRPKFELTTSAFFDIGVPEEYARANDYFADDKFSDEA